MKDKKQSTMDRILNYMFENKLNTSITCIVYLLICKVIDMNTIQWFGDDIFIRNGNVLEFIVAAVFFGSAIVFVFAVIADALKGKLF